MKKQVLAVVCGLSLLLAAGACKKKEETPPMPQTGMPGQQGVMPAQPGAPMGQPGTPMGEQGVPPGHNVMIPKGQSTVVVPDAVKGRWKAVVLVVTDKKTNKQNEYTVNLNSDFDIPGSKLKVHVGEFLPDFKMNGLQITSSSNEPNNPAVAVNVSDGGNQIFPPAGKKWGWIYTKFPTMHPFEHPNYAIGLKAGVKKG
ncbi:MAG: hypothetical protein EHM54_04060 [Nitrospiraceae bacterium]|nr:MAG: hypothetical protein EHM54_04060 [Nitrospiraceae bacterium]